MVGTQMTYHNYPAYVFRMTSLLEKLGIKAAIYVHSDEVREFCERYTFEHCLPTIVDSALTQYIASRGPLVRMDDKL